MSFGMNYLELYWLSMINLIRGKLLGAFNKLRQLRSLNTYIDALEDLRASMLEFNPVLTESHFLHSFISGLQDEIKHNVVMFKPQTLDEAYELVESEERKLDAQRRRNYLKRCTLTPCPFQTRNFGRTTPDSKTTIETKTKQPVTRFKKGQCFKCGDR